MSHSSGLGLLVENMWPLCFDSSSTLSKPVTYTLSRKQWIIPDYTVVFGLNLFYSYIFMCGLEIKVQHVFLCLNSDSHA